jgi:N6-adenosine-specific RNA methylase IME4
MIYFKAKPERRSLCGWDELHTSLFLKYMREERNLLKINDIKVGDRFRKDLGDLEALKHSIQEIGLLHNIVVNENKELICGQRRLEAFKQLGLEEIPATVMNFQDMINPEIHENNVRKDFTIMERYEIRKALEPLEKQKAEERMLLGKPSVNLTKGRVLDNIAKSFGISRNTLNKETAIIEAAKQNPTQFERFIERIDSGKTSVSYVYTMVKRSKDHKKTPNLPTGEFDIILADPPWTYDIMTRGAPDEHYGVMTDEEIENMQVPSSDNAILFLLTTNVKLPVALNVMQKWGFAYITNAVWIKPNIGNGHHFRGQHELLLKGVKGNMPLPQEKDRVSSVIMGPTKEHSEKPDIVYQIMESNYPNRKYLELFSRKERDGWTSWGNEVEVKPEIEIK